MMKRTLGGLGAAALTHPGTAVAAAAAAIPVNTPRLFMSG